MVGFLISPVGSAHHLFVVFFQCEQPSEVIRLSESEEQHLSFSPNISAVVVILNCSCSIIVHSFKKRKHRRQNTAPDLMT